MRPQRNHVERTILCAEQTLGDGVRHAVAIKRESDPKDDCLSANTSPFTNQGSPDDWSDKNPPVKQEQDSPIGNVRTSDPMETSEAESGKGDEKQRAQKTCLGPDVSAARGVDNSQVEPRQSPSRAVRREASSPPVNGAHTERPGSNPRRVSNSSETSTAAETSSRPDPDQRDDTPSVVRDGGSPMTTHVRRASTTGTSAPTTTAPTAPRSQSTTTSTRSQLERLKIPPTPVVSFGQPQSQTPRRDITHVVAKHRVERTAASATAVSPSVRLWNKMSARNKFGKAARAEPDPNPAQLELQRPSEWTPFKVQPAHKANNTAVNKNADDDGLFVSQDEEDEIGEELENQNAQKSSSNPHPASLPQSPVLQQTDTANRRFSLPPLPAQLPEPPSQPSGEHVRQTVSLGSFKVRKWNVGEILCQVSYGEPREEIGDVRLCNLNMEARRAIYALKSHSRIEVHFDDLCNIERYNSITQDVSKHTDCLLLKLF